MQSRFFTVREQWLLLGVAGAIVFGGSVVLWQGHAGPAPAGDSFDLVDEAAASVPVGRPATPDPETAPAPEPQAAPPRPEPPARIGVGVLGAVERPGLYFFDEGARVQDLLEAAGGSLPESNLADINRTAPLLDETTLLVPRIVGDGANAYSDPPVAHNPRPYTRSAWYQFDRTQPAAAASGATASRSRAATDQPGLININTASQSELERLPGVGPATAQKIIAYRRDQPFHRPGDLEKVRGIGPVKMAAVRDLITVSGG